MANEILIFSFVRITLLESIASSVLLDISVHQALRKTTRTLADHVSVIKLALLAVAALLWPRMVKSRQR